MMHKIIVCYGTRPELIKLAPLIWEFQQNGFGEHLIIVNTNQHRETMCEAAFGIEAHHELDVLSHGQSLSQLAALITSRLDTLIQQLSEKYTLAALIAQGDTMTTLCSAQTAFFNRIPFFHIEAGLRSGDTNSPFPEEYNRKTVSLLATRHFAPSELEKQNLLSEGIEPARINVVGNTVNDMLLHFCKAQPEVEKDTILISIHRKANQNGNLGLLLDQILMLVKKYPALNFVWLMHPAPYITAAVSNHSSAITVKSNVPYPDMIQLYKHCKMVITDSGGIIEESAFLGIPRIIVRTDNERKGLLAAADTFIHVPAKLDLADCFERVLKTEGVRNYTYGTGNSAQQIRSILVEELKLREKPQQPISTRYTNG